MTKKAENIVVRTESGTYSIPPEDLERYRVAEEVHRHAEQLHGGSHFNLLVGKHPPIQTPGRIIFSVETKVEMPAKR